MHHDMDKKKREWEAFIIQILDSMLLLLPDEMDRLGLFGYLFFYFLHFHLVLVPDHDGTTDWGPRYGMPFTCFLIIFFKKTARAPSDGWDILVTL